MTDRPSTTQLSESTEGADAVGTKVPFELRGFSLATATLLAGAVISIGSLGEVSWEGKRSLLLYSTINEAKCDDVCCHLLMLWRPCM